MKLKSYLASLGLVLMLSLALVPPCVLATGEDGVDTSDQNPEPGEGQEPGDNQGDNEGEDQDPGSDDSGDSSDGNSGNSTIGGGMNSDSEGSQAQPPSETPTPSTKPSTPIPTIPKPTLPSVVPGLSASQASSSNPRPQGTSGVLATTSTETEPEAGLDESEQELPVLPAAPNDNIAPMQIETPNTGSQETPEINFAAIALLFVAGVTIMSAGIFVTIMQKAANRQTL